MISTHERGKTIRLMKRLLIEKGVKEIKTFFNRKGKKDLQKSL